MTTELMDLRVLRTEDDLRRLAKEDPEQLLLITRAVNSAEVSRGLHSAAIVALSYLEDEQVARQRLQELLRGPDIIVQEVSLDALYDVFSNDYSRVSGEVVGVHAAKALTCIVQTMLKEDCDSFVREIAAEYVQAAAERISCASALADGKPAKRKLAEYIKESANG